MPTKFALFLSLLLVAAQPAFAGSPEAALQLIERRSIGDNLRPMAVTVAHRTQTFAMILSQTGAVQAQTMLSTELDRCAAKYQSQWNTNLARIYAQHFTDEELASLTTEGRNSRFSGKLAANLDSIGTQMERQSKPILNDYVTEALHAVFAKTNASRNR